MQPAADDLSDAQIAVLRAMVESLVTETVASLSASESDAKPVDLELSIGRLSRVDALQQQHMAIARRQRLVLQREQLRAALQRMERGEYGLCARCGEPIGYARLRVRPETAVCLTCQKGGG